MLNVTDENMPYRPVEVYVKLLSNVSSWYRNHKDVPLHQIHINHVETVYVFWAGVLSVLDPALIQVSS